MNLRISGSIANYGKIVAGEKSDLLIGGSMLSLADGTFDSAGRGYGALKQIRGINSAPECPPSSSQLQTAILSENTAAAAKLIESGVDLNDTVSAPFALLIFISRFIESERRYVRRRLPYIGIRRRSPLEMECDRIFPSSMRCLRYTIGGKMTFNCFV